MSFLDRIHCSWCVSHVVCLFGLPIITRTKNWTTKSGVSCSRTQYPVSLAYSITIHKSQGLTLDEAYVDIGMSEKSAGLTYVGLSRVRTLDGLLLHPFSFKRLTELNTKPYIRFYFRSNESIKSCSYCTGIFQNDYIDSINNKCDTCSINNITDFILYFQNTSSTLKTMYFKIYIAKKILFIYIQFVC